MIAFAHMLKDYSVFSFVPKLSYALDSELVCFDAVVFMEMAISICIKSVIE